MEHPIIELKPHVIEASADMIVLVRNARARIWDAIRKASRNHKMPRSARERAKLYGNIGALYEQLNIDIDDWALTTTERTAKTFLAKAAKDMSNKDTVVRFSAEYAKELFERIHPNNAGHIAAVRTKRMTDSDIRQLRTIAIDESRRASIEGLTRTQKAKAMQARWEELARQGGLDSFNFIDAAGKKWKNNNYFSMLARTHTAEVARQSYIDEVVEGASSDTMMLQTAGNPCPFCVLWEGVILSVSGAIAGMPTYQDAREAGVFHPNCVCTLGFVDIDLDFDEIEAQKKDKSIDEIKDDGFYALEPKERRKRLNEYARQIQGNAERRGFVTPRKPGEAFSRPTLKERLERAEKRDEA